MGCGPSKDPAKEKCSAVKVGKSAAKISEAKEEVNNQEQEEKKSGMDAGQEEEKASEKLNDSKEKSPPKDASIAEQKELEAPVVAEHATVKRSEVIPDAEEDKAEVSKEDAKENPEPPVESKEDGESPKKSDRESSLHEDPIKEEIKEEEGKKDAEREKEESDKDSEESSEPKEGEHRKSARKEYLIKTIKEEPANEDNESATEEKKSLELNKDSIPMIIEHKGKDDSISGEGNENREPESELIASGKLRLTQYNTSSFVSSTKSPELASGVASILERYQPVEEAALVKLEPRAKKYYEYAKKLHGEFEQLIEDSRWELYDKGESWAGYTMAVDGLICSKSVGQVMGTPIEVRVW
eukprot:TRINITY_DN5247_c0_g5_i1.p1 TRINITY_DN5247_c0_g5~~TRINITY_DN5247_c0_g5_i1.p1  ORF type:complete len:355 (+),score=131.90 TRINITY_DN5247_c0_g5_i1:168-1232(+)